MSLTNLLSEPLTLTEENLVSLSEAMSAELTALGVQILGDRAKAEDVLSEVVVRLLGKIKKSGPLEITYPRGWLHSVYRRRAYRFLKKQRPEVSLSFGQEDATEIELPDLDAALRIEWKILAEELMQAMPDRLRFMVEMRAFQYNWGEIAEMIFGDSSLRAMFRVKGTVPTTEDINALSARLRQIYAREMSRASWRRPG